MLDEVRQVGERDSRPAEFNNRPVEQPDETPEQKIQSLTSLDQIFDFVALVKRGEIVGGVWKLLKTRALEICEQYTESLQTNPDKLSTYRLELGKISLCNLLDTTELENFAKDWADAVAQKPE